MKPPRERAGGRRASQGVGRPVDYAARVRYRRPPSLYLRMQWLAPLITRWGVTPGYVITLEVPGRRTGIVHRTALVQVVHQGQRFVVALAGESEWVRNVRAAAGSVVVRRRRRYRATLVEVPAGERADVIRAYLLRPGLRRGSPVRVGEARSYFGLSAQASLDEIRPIVEHYPVFRIVPDAHTS